MWTCGWGLLTPSWSLQGWSGWDFFCRRILDVHHLGWSFSRFSFPISFSSQFVESEGEGKKSRMSKHKLRRPFHSLHWPLLLGSGRRVNNRPGAESGRDFLHSFELYSLFYAPIHPTPWGAWDHHFRNHLEFCSVKKVFLGPHRANSGGIFLSTAISSYTFHCFQPPKFYDCDFLFSFPYLVGLCLFEKSLCYRFSEVSEGNKSQYVCLSPRLYLSAPMWSLRGMDVTWADLCFNILFLWFVGEWIGEEQAGSLHYRVHTRRDKDGARWGRERRKEMHGSKACVVCAKDSLMLRNEGEGVTRASCLNNWTHAGVTYQHGENC